MYKTKKVRDMLGRVIEIPEKPKRVISLVPSKTELLYYFGLNQEVVGQTLFCVHPKEMHQTKIKVGGTKNVNFDKIKALQPDLIIANKEENDKEQIEELAKHYPVWVSDIVDLQSALQMIFMLGNLFKRGKEANALCANIASKFKTIKVLNKPINTAYLIWYNPIMAAGKNTFINNILHLAGFKNYFTDKISRYPEIEVNELQNADLILLSSEPFPFKEKHINEIQLINPKAKIILVDGEMFSWYGSRLLLTPNYINLLLKDIV